MTDAFAAIVTAFTRAVEAGDGAGLAALFTEDGVYHDGFYGAFAGRSAIADMLDAHFHGAARDFRWEMRDLLADDAQGYARWRFSYVSTLPASDGRRVVFTGISRFDLEGGLIRRYREVFDRGTALAQLDFAPERIKRGLVRWAAADAAGFED